MYFHMFSKFEQTFRQGHPTPQEHRISHWLRGKVSFVFIIPLISRLVSNFLNILIKDISVNFVIFKFRLLSFTVHFHILHKATMTNMCLKMLVSLSFISPITAKLQNGIATNDIITYFILVFFFSSFFLPFLA